MPAAIPTLNALWRPNGSSTRDDRELIRGYAMWPVSAYNLTQLTSVLNRVADTSAATVAQVQAWIDEVEDLEQTWADQVADGTAHLGNVQSYEGPVPGATLSRDDLKKRADVLEWDTSLLRVKYESGGRPDATAGGTIAGRIAQLKSRILETIGIKATDRAGGGQAAPAAELMATDFAPYANLRFLWPRPAAITSLRDGIPVSTDLVVIEVFVKGAGATPQEMQSLRYGTRVMEGFVTRYATLPAGGDWLGSGVSITTSPNRLTYAYFNNTYDTLSRFAITEVTNPNWVQRVDGTIGVYINNAALAPNQYSIEENVTLDRVEVVLASPVTSSSNINYGVEWQWDQVTTVPAWSWTDTGLMPAGLAAEALCRAYLGDLTSLPTRTNGGILGEVTILGLAGQFGVGGIGAELRAALGDAIRVSFAAVQ